jgi:hypothetical protein
MPSFRLPVRAVCLLRGISGPRGEVRLLDGFAAWSDGACTIQRAMCQFSVARLGNGPGCSWKPSIALKYRRQRPRF